MRFYFILQKSPLSLQLLLKFVEASGREKLCADKCKVALNAGMKVMFAIGEKKEEREGGITMKVCAKQLEPLAKVLDEKDWESVAIGKFLLNVRIRFCSTS